MKGGRLIFQRGASVQFILSAVLMLDLELVSYHLEFGLEKWLELR